MSQIQVVSDDRKHVVDLIEADDDLYGISCNCGWTADPNRVWRLSAAIAEAEVHAGNG